MSLPLKVFEIISPVILLVLVGYFCKRINLLSLQTSKELNKFIFYVSLPCLLASKIATIDLNLANHWLAYISILVATLLTGLLGILGSKYFGIKGKLKWVSAHGGARSNMAFIGLPIIMFIANSKTLSTAILLMGLTIPFYNVMGVVFLTIGKKSNVRPNFSETFMAMIISIMKNPLIIGCLCGAIFYEMQLKENNFLIKNMNLLGSVSLSLSLICLGVQMNLTLTKDRIERVVFPVFLKLFISPILGVLFLHLFVSSPSPDVILSVLVLVACPSAVASYVMAVEMDADHEFASDLVLASTLFSFFSLSLFLTVFFMWFPSF